MSERRQEYLMRVEQRPQDTLARFVLAKDLFDDQADGEAIAHLRLLVEQKPDWMKAWILLGQSLARIGQVEEARTALGQALSLARAQHHEGPEAEIADLLRHLG